MKAPIINLAMALFVGLILNGCDFVPKTQNQKPDPGSDWFVTMSGNSIL